MSRVAKRPVEILKGVEIKLEGNQVSAKGPKGTDSFSVPPKVKISLDDGLMTFEPENNEPSAWAFAGTARALAANLVKGVSEGFEKKLELRGVGYRATMQGKTVVLSLGYSHPVEFTPPEGVTIEANSQTELTVRGASKQAVGQVAAVIRGFRPPEPYKGKGVRYVGENVVMKEAKKK